eukprot:scaffold291928_cov15-Prasinocladus_malaysianus.AAC.1
MPWFRAVDRIQVGCCCLNVQYPILSPLRSDRYLPCHATKLVTNPLKIGLPKSRQLLLMRSIASSTVLNARHGQPHYWPFGD